MAEFGVCMGSSYVDFPYNMAIKLLKLSKNMVLLWKRDPNVNVCFLFNKLCVCCALEHFCVLVCFCSFDLIISEQCMHRTAFDDVC